MSLTYEIQPLISEQVLNAIEPGEHAGKELLAKQFDSGQARIVLKDRETGTVIDSLEYQAEPGMSGREFKSLLTREALRMIAAEASV